MLKSFFAVEETTEKTPIVKLELCFWVACGWLGGNAYRRGYDEEIYIRKVEVG